ncbi:uncharacterized protein RhoGAP15B [Hetaerina americana]|uniref:uncharacterized protein RhoGAP15B n=1 Tax=Hetaerina americana TaxID=62018 RepID=UPI003A7F5361
MDPTAPVPMPRAGGAAKKDALSSSLTDLSPTGKLPPTPAKRPIPLPRLKSAVRGERNILATLTRRPSNASTTASTKSAEEPVGMGDELNDMPALFRSITFPSPLKEEELKWSTVTGGGTICNEGDTVVKEGGRDVERTPSPEPPFYPPPPLPDESVYDEVQSPSVSRGSPWFSALPIPHSQSVSSKQSHSGEEEAGEETYAGSNQSSTYYPCSFSSWADFSDDFEESIYEDVAIGSPSSGGGGSSHTGDYSSGSEGLSLTPKKLSVLRCDSWSFYDAVEIALGQEKTVEGEGGAGERPGRVKLLSATEHCPEEYENVVIVTPRSTITSDVGDPFFPDPPPCVSAKTPELPVTPTTPSLFPDRMPLLIPSPSNVPTSPQWPDEKTQSISSDGLCKEVDNAGFTRVKPNQRSSSARRVTPSVILEFDPLFNNTGLCQQSHSTPQLGNIFEISSQEESPYGRIQKISSQRQARRVEDNKNHSIGAITEESSATDAVGPCEKSLSVPDISHSSRDSSPNSMNCSFHRRPARRVCKNKAQLDTGVVLKSEPEGEVDKSEVQPSSGEVVSVPLEPPPPPVRKDSIASGVSLDSEGTVVSEPGESESSSPFRFRRSGLVRWSSVKRAMKFLNGDRTIPSSDSAPSVDQAADNKLSIFYNKPESDQKPGDSSELGAVDFVVDHTLQHSGLLYQLNSGAVGVVTGSSWGSAQVRWFNLCRGKLTWWRERGGAGPSSCLPLEQLASIRVTSDRANPSADGEVLSCFELGVVGGRSNWINRHTGGGALPSHTLLLGSMSSTERRLWMQKLLESVVPPSCFPNFAVMDFTRAGCAHIKEGISGNWCKGWMLLYQRMFFYCLVGSSTAKEANLQHARCIRVNKEDDGSGPSILLDLQGGNSIYLRPIATEGSTFLPNAGNKFLVSKSAINGWKSALKTAALESGPGIADQQLTLENIPVIVDKCLNFVYTHGGMSEGIYRRSGSNSSVTRLLTEFQRNAWDVQLTRRDYSEYDVAAVLKRFFRDLPEPLLTSALHDDICKIAELDPKDKVQSYRRILEKLPCVNYVTLRRLLAHLSYVHSQQERNLMPVDNLAAIWGPTLMHVEGNDSLGWSRRESEAVLDLVSLFRSLYDVSPEEDERERQMQEVLERHFLAASVSPASSSGVGPQSSPRMTRRGQENKMAFPGGWTPPSGDLKVWIHVFPTQPSAKGDKGSSCIHVTVTPQKLSGQLVLDLCEQLGLDGKGQSWGLEERILGSALTRPLHPMERVLDVVLRWGYWDDVDRKDNLLALTPSTLLLEAAHLARTKPPTIVNGELRFADARSKSFRTYMFEFSQAKLSCYKDKRGSVKLAEWKVEDILWYLGHEPKRNPQSRWSITFIDKAKKTSRKKETPFFGNTIAGTSSSEMLHLVTAMLLSEHPEGLSFPLSPDLLV